MRYLLAISLLVSLPFIFSSQDTAKKTPQIKKVSTSSQKVEISAPVIPIASPQVKVTASESTDTFEEEFWDDIHSRWHIEIEQFLYSEDPENAPDLLQKYLEEWTRLKVNWQKLMSEKAPNESFDREVARYDRKLREIFGPLYEKAEKRNDEFNELIRYSHPNLDSISIGI